MKVAVYSRVSTMDQATEGVSLAAQAAKLNDYAKLHDLEIAAELVDEGLSAKAVVHRPGAVKLIELVSKKQIDGVVIYKLDRLFRNTRDAIDFAELCRKKDVSFHSISESIDTSTAIGSFFFVTIAALAELERKQTGERTAAALSYKKSKGEKTGGEVPYGYLVDEQIAPDGSSVKVLAPDKAEQKTLAQMIAWREEGRSLRHIAHLLMRRGVKTKQGKTTWGIGVVGRLLKREMTEGVFSL